MIVLILVLGVLVSIIVGAAAWQIVADERASRAAARARSAAMLRGRELDRVIVEGFDEEAVADTQAEASPPNNIC